MVQQTSSSSLGNYGVYEANLRQLSQVQSDYQTAQQQAATGLISNFYSENAINARESLNTKVDRQDLVQISDNIKVVKERAINAETSIRTLDTITTQFKVRLKSILDSGQPQDLAFQLDCQNWMKQAEDALNVRDVNGNAIFGGTEYAKNPYDASLTPVPDLISGVSSAPFQGNNKAINKQVGLNTTTQINPDGSNDTYLQVFYFLQIGANYAPDQNPTSTNTQMLKKAYAAADETTKGLSKELQTVLGLQSQLKGNQEVIDDQQAVLTEKQKQLDGIDPLEAYMLMMQLEQQNLFTYTGLLKNNELQKQILNLAL